MHLRASPQRRDRIFIVRVEKMLVKSVEGGTLLVILTILLINDHGNISTYKISPYVKTKEMLPNLSFKYLHIQYIYDQNSEIDTNRQLNMIVLNLQIQVDMSRKWSFAA